MDNKLENKYWKIPSRLVIASTIAAFFGINAWVQQKTTLELQQIQNQSLTETAYTLARNLTRALVIDDYADVEKRLEDVFNEKDYIQSIVLTRPNGIDILKLSRLNPGGLVEIEYPSMSQQKTFEEPQGSQNNSPVLSKKVSVNAGTANLGSLKINSWKSTLENRVELIKSTIFLSSIFSMLPAFGAIFYAALTRNRAEVHMITEEKNKQLMKANVLAESASIAKTEFLSRMTHELRTPMNAVLGITHLAMQAEPEARQLNYLRKIQKSGNNLLSIINDILDFSKIEAGKLTLNQSTFLLAEVIDDVVGLVADSIFNKDIEFVVIVDPRIPNTLWGDSFRLIQILVNLLSNASKFTEHGTISLRASVVAINSEQTTLQFSVQDSGIGIKKDQIKTLFEDFQQAEPSTTRKFGGSGLGLSICKHLVELMQGSINVESALGEGSCFIVKLPFGVLEPVATSEPEERFNYKNGLILASHDLLKEEVQKILRRLGINTEIANNLDEMRVNCMTAYENAVPYDLILVDHCLLNDVEDLIFSQGSQGQFLEAKPTIILMTIPSKSRHLIQLDSSLVKASIPKPILMESMKACLQQIDTSISTSKSDRKTKNLVDTLPNNWKFDQLRVLLVEDNPINEEICRELLMNAGIHVFSAMHGKDALEWLQLNTPTGNGTTAMPCEVILMDLDMPIMSGWECTEQIRKNPHWSGIPILAMSAHAMEQEKSRSMAMGFQDYITKPFHPNHLYERIEHWSRKKNSNSVKNSQLSDQELSISGINTQEALKRLGGNQKLYKRMLRAFVQSHGQTGNTLSMYLQQNEWSDAKRLIHTIKGLTLTLGITALADSSKELEKQLKAHKSPQDLMIKFNQDLIKSIAEIEQFLDIDEQ